MAETLELVYGYKPEWIEKNLDLHKTAMALYPEHFGKSPYLDWDREC